jgi:hypothetical protein
MGKRREQRTRIALPVKVYTRDDQGRTIIEIACTMDITPKGARLTGVRCITHAGEVLQVERGKSKAFYRVMWVGDRMTNSEGQVGLQCIEPDAAIWGMDLLPGEDERYESMKAAGGSEERRRKKRHACEGIATIFINGDTSNALYGQLSDISSLGCYIRMGAPPPSQSRLRVNLKLVSHKVELNIRGTVGMSDKALGMFVNFTEIAQSDAVVLEKLLGKLEAQNS